MAGLRRRMAARAESEYRLRRQGGATFFTSRRVYQDLTIVVKRFPRLHEGDGPTFVLVHGIGVSSRYYQPAAAELAEHGTVYLVDLPGYGAAPNPRRAVSIADHAGVLAALLAEARAGKPVLVGHSMGSQVVSRLAVDSPGVTDRIVLMAPTMPVGERRFWPAAWRLVVDGLRNPPTANLIVAYDYFVRCGIPYFIEQTKHLFGDRIEDRIGLITQKTLVLNGDHDLVVPGYWARRIADGIPGARYAEVKGPHLIMWSDPKGVAMHIAEHAKS